MDGDCSKADTNFVRDNLCGARHDRISELGDEIKIMILSLLPLREAAAASVLSSSWSDLWKHTPNLRFDRISKLPDQIIVLILSFLPMRKAAGTSVLSSRWSNLWKQSPNLNFSTSRRKWEDTRPRVVRDKCKYVEYVLQSHKTPSPLKQFRISFYIDKSAQFHVSKWLEVVFLRQVERLELDFQCWLWKEEYPELEEILRGSVISLPKSLKTLFLAYTNVSGEAIELILRSCPLLEELTMAGTSLTSDVDICGESLMLKHLEIHASSFNGKSVKVSAPKLTWLNVDDFSEKLLVQNVSEHVRAHLRIVSCCPDAAERLASGVLFCISSQLRILSITLGCHPEMFIGNGLPEMPNLKKITVRYSDSIMPRSLLSLTAFIWASPRLEEFKLLIPVTLEDSTAYKKVEEPDLERSPHHHLKVFELSAHPPRGEADSFNELVACISNNCIALQKIIFGPHSWFPYFRQLQHQLPQHTQLQFL